MLVTTARIGLSLRNEPSLSSDSTTRKSLWPTRAFEPPMEATLPPTTTVGSRPASVQNGRGHRSRGGLSVAAGDGDAVLQAHQLGQQLAARDHRDVQTPRFQHLRICGSTAELTTTALAASDVRGGMALENQRPKRARRSVVALSFRSEPVI